MSQAFKVGLVEAAEVSTRALSDMQGPVSAVPDQHPQGGTHVGRGAAQGVAGFEQAGFWMSTTGLAPPR